MKSKELVLIWIVLFFSFPTFGQEAIFGRYSAHEIALEEVGYEPEADAVILEEISNNVIEIPEINSTIQRRIKILKPSGISKGSVHIRFPANYVNIVKIRAQIMNVQEGQQVITALNEKDFLVVDIGNGLKEMRFTLPDVKVGSIIEYEYVQADKRLTILEPWIFQNNLPTLSSIYSISIPSELNYRVLSQGEQAIKYQFDSRKDGTYKWALQRLKSYSEEPYMSNYADYLEKIEFQLAGYGFRSSNNVFSDWADLSQFIMLLEESKSFVKPNKSIIEKIASISVFGETQMAKAKFLYSYVTSEYEHDGYAGIIPSEGLKDILESKKGSRPELNLLLMTFLNYHDIEAFPVLISSKGNGRTTLVNSPFADQFNQMILLVKADGKFFFVDATDKEMPFGYLPLAFHVDKGFILNDKESGLIPITTTHRTGINQSVKIKINTENALTSEAVIRFLDYDAIGLAGKIAELNSDEVKEKFFQIDDEPISDFSFAIKNEPRKTIDAKMIKSLENFGSDLVFIKPFQYIRWEENPFISESRTFPIDFYHTFIDNFTTIIEIPEGYVLDDFPEEISIALPGNTFIFNYKIEPLEGIVKINATSELRQTIIPSGVYPDLKYFMEILTSKLKEPVVLKKIAHP